MKRVGRIANPSEKSRTQWKSVLPPAGPVPLPLAHGSVAMRVNHLGRWLALPALLLVAAAGVPAPEKADADKVQVKVVAYADLGKTIKELKGKIIVVDFWADT